MDIVKILLTTPIMWILYGLIVALILLRGSAKGSRSRRGWYLLTAMVVMIVLLSLPISVDLARYSLARQYGVPTQEVLNTLDMIVVLGGGIEVKRDQEIQAQPSPATFERVVKGVEVFGQSRAKRLILSGGPQQDGAPSEAAVMKTVAVSKGTSAEKIILEERSRNTAQEAIEVARLLQGEKSVNTLGIVTSGVHMPRALRIFRSQLPHLTLVAVPAGSFQPSFLPTLLDVIPSAHALSVMTSVFHEWIGIAWYAFRY